MSTSDVGWNLTLLFKSLLWNIGRKKYGWFWWFTSTWSSSIATLNQQRVIHLDPSQTYNLRQVVDWERLSKVKALIGLIGIGKAWISRHVDRCWPFVWVFCKPFCRTEFDDETTSGIIREHQKWVIASIASCTWSLCWQILRGLSLMITWFFFSTLDSWRLVDWLVGRQKVTSSPNQRSKCKRSEVTWMCPVKTVAAWHCLAKTMCQICRFDHVSTPQNGMFSTT